MPVSSFLTGIPDDVLIKFDSPDDEHWVARNMYRREINKYIEKSASNWLLTRNIQSYLTSCRGSLVVKALRYKPAGRGFDSRWFHWNFSVT